MAGSPAAVSVLGGQRMRGVRPGARQQRPAVGVQCISYSSQRGGRGRPTLALRGGSANADADDDDDAALRAAIQEAQQEAAAAEAQAGRGYGQEHSQAGEDSLGGARRVWRTARGVALPDDPQGVCQPLRARALRGAPLARGRRDRRGA